MDSTLDLDAYLERIGWRGDARPTFETLATLLDAHMSRIPFENLDVLLGRRIRLDLDGVQRKLVRACRGGYCFEHATLFAAVLEAFAFRPARHCARVTMYKPRTEAPRTHMFLTVALAEGTFVVDPGFGSLASRAPVPLVDAADTHGAHDTHWMTRDDNLWTLHARSGDGTIDAWVSTMEQDNPVDFEMGNHFTATYPVSPFVNHLMMRALTPDGRVTVMDREVTHWGAATARKSRLEGRAALRALLHEHFGFDLPEVEQMRVSSIPEWT